MAACATINYLLPPEDKRLLSLPPHCKKCHTKKLLASKSFLSLSLCVCVCVCVKRMICYCFKCILCFPVDQFHSFACSADLLLCDCRTFCATLKIKLNNEPSDRIVATFSVTLHRNYTLLEYNCKTKCYQNISVWGKRCIFIM